MGREAGSFVRTSVLKTHRVIYTGQIMTGFMLLLQ